MNKENRTLARRHAFARWRKKGPGFCDALTLRYTYARIPSNLLTSCNGCGKIKKFDVNHVLDCKKGDLITIQHGEIHDELRSTSTGIYSIPYLVQTYNESCSDACQCYQSSCVKCFLLIRLSECRSQ